MRMCAIIFIPENCQLPTLLLLLLHCCCCWFHHPRRRHFLCLPFFFGAQRSLLAMLIVAALATMDPLALKESVTVVAPDHKPLLAVVGIFGERLRQTLRNPRALATAADRKHLLAFRLQNAKKTHLRLLAFIFHLVLIFIFGLDFLLYLESISLVWRFLP